MSFDGAVYSVSGGCIGSQSFDWDFGEDGSHASTLNASHTYQSPGTYSWRLTVSVTNGQA